MSDDYNPKVARFAGWVCHGFSRAWFRFRMRGADRLPSGTCLVIGNHSAIGIVDIICALGGQYEHLPERRVVGMMHDAFIHAPLAGRLFRTFGAVRARCEAARQALADGLDVIAYPGGNLDSCRSMLEPREVVFGERRGYLRIALEAGVPIVPLATIGSAWSYLLVPWLGDATARLIRLKKWTRFDRLPLTVGHLGIIATVAAVAVAPVPWWAIPIAVVVSFIPNPIRVTSEFLEPIDVCGATAHIEDEDERLDAAHALVHGALQNAVRTMSHKG